MSDTSGICANCDTKLKGSFCHKCGEKQLNPERDFSIKNFLTETFEHFTHLESKVIRSIVFLFIRPGFLTAEFIAGRRKRYMKPIPMFVLASLVFYVLFPKATSFYINIDDMSRGFVQHNPITNIFQIDTKLILDTRAAAQQISPELFWKDIVSEKAAHLSKSWLFLLAPFWGLLIWPLLYRKSKWLVPHLVYALHGFSFFILFDLVSITFMRYVMGYTQLYDAFVYFLICSFMAYNILAIRRLYGKIGIVSMLSGVLVTVLFFLLLLIYRQMITVWVLLYG